MVRQFIGLLLMAAGVMGVCYYFTSSPLLAGAVGAFGVGLMILPTGGPPSGVVAA